MPQRKAVIRVPSRTAFSSPTKIRQRTAATVVMHRSETTRTLVYRLPILSASICKKESMGSSVTREIMPK